MRATVLRNLFCQFETKLGKIVLKLMTKVMAYLALSIMLTYQTSLMIFYNKKNKAVNFLVTFLASTQESKSETLHKVFKQNWAGFETTGHKNFEIIQFISNMRGDAIVLMISAHVPISQTERIFVTSLVFTNYTFFLGYFNSS